MKLTVKTLKGGKFEIQVEETSTVAQVKGIIETAKPELPASATKLIHSGKVLGKDDDTMAACGIKENDFLVVMATKPKKAAAPAPVAAAAPADSSAAPAPTPKAADAPKTEETTAAATATPAAPAASATATPAAPARSADTFSDEAVNNLMAMGFPEAEVRHCLRAAHGNPDVAVEFLTNGIPDGMAEAAAVMGSQTPAAAGASSSGAPLQALRNHPQFDALRRLVQSNPAMLQQVLTQIGQQQPELLQEINANQPLFLEMMNEPVTESSSTANNASGAQASPSAGSRPAGFPGMMEGMGNPGQMAQMIQSMNPEELAQMAAMMGLSPDQLRQTAQMIGQMPPEQLNNFMMQAMGGGAGGLMGEAGGQQVLRLSEEEMAAVDRLAEMGFDRSEAAQAFLACDKNEALAANLLMDSMGDGGGLFGGDNSNNDNNQNGNNGDDDDDDDNMYD